MRTLVIYPSSRDCGGSDTGCRGGGRDVRAGVLRYLIS